MSSPVYSFASSPDFLRNVLRADALSCIACGLLQVVFTSQIVELLSLRRALVAYSGEFLLAYGAAVAFISTRTPLPRPVVVLLVVGNLGWGVACIVLLFAGKLEPSILGTTYVVVQALTVVVLAALQYLGLRRAAPQPAW